MISGRKLIVGFALIMIGALFLVRSMDIVYFGIGDFFGNIVPLALIGGGVWLIVRKRRSEKMSQEFDQANQTFGGPQEVHNSASSSRPDAPPPPGGDHQDSFEQGPKNHQNQQSQGDQTEAPSTSMPGKIKYNKGFGDMFVNLDGMSLQSIEISTFIGDVEVKLHGGKLGPGLNRMVISGFIGDVRVMVPRGMAVYTQASSFIGDLELFGNRTDGFGNNLEGQTINYEGADSKLYVATNCFIGDVRIFEI